MPTNDQKTPLGWALHDFVSGKARGVVDLLGKSIPCHVVKVVSSGIVVVAFDITGLGTLPQVMMPVAMNQYDRVPIQEGEKGYAQAADFYLGGVSALGGGTATATQQSNLSTLSFVPLGNSGWSSVDLNTHVVMGGPHGTIVQNANGDHIITIPATGNVTIVVPSGAEVVISSGGSTQPVKLADGSNSIVLMAQ